MIHDFSTLNFIFTEETSESAKLFLSIVKYSKTCPGAPIEIVPGKDDEELIVIEDEAIAFFAVISMLSILRSADLEIVTVPVSPALIFGTSCFSVTETIVIGGAVTVVVAVVVVVAAPPPPPPPLLELELLAAVVVVVVVETVPPSPTVPEVFPAAKVPVVSPNGSAKTKLLARIKKTDEIIARL